MSREELIEQEAQSKAKKRMALDKGVTQQRIDQILDEERDRERKKVEEGEAWAMSLDYATKLFCDGKRANPKYIGFRDGRRTFQL